MKRLAALLILFVALPALADGNWTGSGGSTSGSGTSSAGVTTYVESRNPISGSDPCSTGDTWTNSVTDHPWYCENGATDAWTEYEESRVLCTAGAAQVSTTDGQLIGAIFSQDVQIIKFTCQDATNATAGITTPYTVTLKRSDNGNQIGSADATCSGKDAAATWVSTSADTDGALVSGKSVMTDVSNSPNPTSARVIYCVEALIQ